MDSRLWIMDYGFKIQDFPKMLDKANLQKLLTNELL